MDENDTAVRLAGLERSKIRLRLEYILCSHFCTLRRRVEFSETVPTDHGLILMYLLTKG